MQNSATLIDNIFISEQLQCSFDSAILVDNISDHLPCLPLLHQTRIGNKSPLEFKSRNLNARKIEVINDTLRNKDWNGLLNSTDCSSNFDKFCDILHETMEDVAPLRTFRISVRRRFVEPWMTTGLENTMRKNKSLYKETLKQDCEHTKVDEYKCHRNMLN